MKLQKLIIFIVSIIAFKAFAKAQTKVVECGNMSVTIPQKWTSSIDDKESGIGSKLILVYDENKNHIYMIGEYSMNATPDYILQSGVINNPTLNSNAEFGDIEKISYQSYDACSVLFNNIFFGMTKVGKAIAFCEKSRSYAIIAMANPGESFKNDIVFNSFRLTGKEISEVNTKSTREQIIGLINEFQKYFGTQISQGVSFDNLELAPNNNILTFTYGISLFSKDDLDEETINEIYNSMKGDMMNGLNQMANSFKVIQQCKDESYTFILKIVDKNKTELFSYTITPKDYKKQK